MSSTYLKLCQDLRQEVGVAGTGLATVVGQTGMMAKIVKWIADADITLQLRWLDWSFLWSQFSQNTIANNYNIPAPSDFGEWDIDSFWLDYGTDPHKLRVMPYEDWRNTYPFSTTADKPSSVVVKPDNDLVLFPTPDAVYSFSADYWRTPTRLEDNGDTSPIPTRFDRAIVCQAKLFYAEHENAPEVYQIATTELGYLLSRMESLYLPGQKARYKATDTDLVMVVE